MPPRKRGRPSKSRAKQDSDEEESEAQFEEQEDDDEEEEEDDDDAPRKVQIIPLEKMRGTGGVEYEDHKLHRNTLLFLRDLKANNKRTWLKSACFQLFLGHARPF